MAKTIEDRKTVMSAQSVKLHKPMLQLYGCVRSEATPPPRTKTEARAQIRRMMEKKQASLDVLAEL